MLRVVRCPGRGDAVRRGWWAGWLLGDWLHVQVGRALREQALNGNGIVLDLVWLGGNTWQGVLTPCHF
jgi:hypothetical protein